MDEEVSLLIQSFADLSNSDQKVRDPANESILELIQNNPIHFLFLSSQIIHLDELPDSIYRMALTLMGHTLTPSLKVPIQMIESEFLDPANDDERKLIREASFRGLMFSDKVIRQQASYCVSLIFQMEKDQWSELFPSLFEIASSNSSVYSMEAHCGVIYCFKNIIQSDIPFDFLEEFIDNFLSFTIHVLLSSEIESELFYDECFDCYISILDRIERASKIDNEVADKCFEVIEKSINNFELTKSRFFLSALFIIFKSIYSTSVFDYIGKYLEITKQILEEGEFDQQIDVINRWDDIAQFEIQQENSQSIISAISNDFFPIILKVISVGFESIDDINAIFDPDSSTEIEESSKQALSAGCNCLSSFYKAAPNDIFSCIKELCDFESVSDENQIIISLFLLQAIIMRDPQNDELENFLFDDIKEILLKMIMNENLCISILSLILIQKSISKFGCFVKTKEEIENLLIEISNCYEANEEVMPYCCNIIYHMCTYACKLIEAGLNSLDNSFIAENFDQILEILNIFISQTDSYKNIISSFDAFTLFISLIPKSQISLISDIQENIIIKIINQTLSNPDDFSKEVLFALQVSMIKLIEEISYRLKKDNLNLEDTPQLIQFLFELTKQEQTTIYEETMFSFSAILFCIGTDYAPYADQTMDLILIMLQTGSPNIIQQAINTISDLFRILKNIMKDYASPVFKLLIPMIYEGNLPRELIIDIIMTLNDIVRFTDEMQYEDQVEFLKIIIQLSQTIKCDLSNISDRPFINSFFTAFFYAYATLIKHSQDTQLFEDVSYAESVGPLIDLYVSNNIFPGDTIYNSSLFRFIKLVKWVGILYGKSISKKINNRKIRRLIVNARDNDSEKFKEFKKQAEKTLNTIGKL